MRTYWIIWECEDCPNGYNQAIFATLDELANYILESSVEGMLVKTIDVFEDDAAIAWFLDGDEVEYNGVKVYE